MPGAHREVETIDAPPDKHHSSQAVRVGSMMFFTGQIGINPVTNHLVEGGIQDELKQAFNNVKAVLEAGGGRLDDIVMIKLCMRDLSEFERMDIMYTEIMSGVHVRPARTVFQCHMMGHARVQIEAIAVLSPG